MSIFEYQLWIAHESENPLPDPWLQTGTIAAANANLWSTKRVIQPDEYIPKRINRQPMTSKQIMAAVAMSAPIVVVSPKD